MNSSGVVLHIDTSVARQATVRLVHAATTYEKTESSSQLKAQVLIPLIDTLLKEHGYAFSDVSEIRVNTGPGSFTGIRVGIAVANTLATFLGVPINGKTVLVQPTYS